MDAYEALLTRRSIRRYTEEAIDEATMKKILTAAMSAPSGKNLQPWEFVVITDHNTLVKMADIRPYWKMLKTAPAAIVVLADLATYTADSPMYVQDCSAATQNILLAANALGLGAVWLGLYPREVPMNDVRALLEIPESSVPISVISIGHPAEQRPAHAEADLDWTRVHYGKY